MSYNRTYKNKVVIKKAKSFSDYVKLTISFAIIMATITICCYWFLFKYHQKSLLAKVDICVAELNQLKELNATLFKEKTVLDQKLQVKEEESAVIKKDLLRSYEDKSSMEKKILLYKKVIKNKG